MYHISIIRGCFLGESEENTMVNGSVRNETFESLQFLLGVYNTFKQNNGKTSFLSINLGYQEPVNYSIEIYFDEVVYLRVFHEIMGYDISYSYELSFDDFTNVVYKTDPNLELLEIFNPVVW